jgi:hypothetical protein
MVSEVGFLARTMKECLTNIPGDSMLVILSLFTHVFFSLDVLLATCFDPNWSLSGYISLVSYYTVSLIGNFRSRVTRLPVCYLQETHRNATLQTEYTWNV